MINIPKNLTVLVEPTAECNMRCRHCYHAKSEYTKHRMSIDLLNKLLKCISKYYKEIKIIWHGGEPLLMGEEFFCSAYNIFDEYTSKYDMRFKFGIQTNGVLLNDELIKLFEKTKTHISISFDGIYNDVLRQKTREVKSVIKKLKKNGIDFSCMSTVSAININHMKEMYEYFKDLSVSVKFNPIYPDGVAKQNESLLITKEEWTSRYIDLFEYWFYDVNCNISFLTCIDMLKKYLNSYFGCLGATCLYRYLATDSYGNIYPCGRLICDDYKFINIEEINDIREVYMIKKYVELLNDSIARIANCKQCRWVSRCHSGCNALAYVGGNILKPYSFDCYFTKQLFNKIDKLLVNSNNKAINRYAKELIG